MDLLTNPFHTVYAVNCRVDGDTLHIGGLYLSPRQQHAVIRLSDNTAKLDVRLPPELLDKPDAHKAWDVELGIVENYGQVQRSV